MAEILNLIKPEILGLKNRLKRRSKADTWKALSLFFFAVLLYFLIYIIFIKVLTYFHSIPGFGDFLTKKLLLITFLTFFFFLIFSSLITSLSAYFLSRELNLILANPVSLTQIYYSRFLLSLFESSWMVFIIALPILFAYRSVFKAGLLFYAYGTMALIPLFIICNAIGTFLTTIIVSAFPARRVRDFLVIISLVIFGGLYILFRILQPEKLINPDVFKTLADYFTTLTVPDSYLLPSVWAAEFLMSLLTGKGEGFFNLLALFSTAAAFLIFGEFFHLRIYHSAWSKAQEAKGARLSRSALLDILTKPFVRLVGTQMRAIILKDTKTFFRDAAQWTQMLLLLALIVVYILNFRLIPFDRVPDISFFLKNLVSFLNLGLAGFVLSAIAVRFVYPSVSLEGKNFWILRSSPLSTGGYLWSKFLANIIPFLLLGEILIVISNYVLKVTPFMMLLGIITIFLMVFGVVSLGIGFGAAFPRFHLDNPARIAAGFGGFMFMIVSLLFIGLIVLLEGYPTYMLFFAEIRNIELGGGEWLLICLCFAGSFLLNLLVFYFSMKWGIASLERMEF